MSVLSRAKPINEIGKSKMVVIYGQSNTGKTVLSSTFPKPMLYLQIGDEGLNPISNEDGIKVIRLETAVELKQVLDELNKTDTDYESIVIDTFSLYVNVWTHDNIISKNKKMTQQDWGNLKTDTEEVIRLAHKLATKKWIVLTCHEISFQSITHLPRPVTVFGIGQLLVFALHRHTETGTPHVAIYHVALPF